MKSFFIDCLQSSGSLYIHLISCLPTRKFSFKNGSGGEAQLYINMTLNKNQIKNVFSINRCLKNTYFLDLTKTGAGGLFVGAILRS